MRRRAARATRRLAWSNSERIVGGRQPVELGLAGRQDTHGVAERLARPGEGPLSLVGGRRPANPVHGPNRRAGTLPEPGGDLPDPKDAMKRFNKRQDAQALSEEGRVRLENNDCTGATQSLEDARELAPDNHQITQNLSLVYERCGEPEKAAKVLEDFLESNPSADQRIQETIKERITALRTTVR